MSTETPAGGRIIRHTDSALHDERAAILNNLGIDLATLTERAATHNLDDRERDAWERCKTIAFLLGETPADGHVRVAEARAGNDVWACYCGSQLARDNDPDPVYRHRIYQHVTHCQEAR